MGISVHSKWREWSFYPSNKNDVTDSIEADEYPEKIFFGDEKLDIEEDME